MNIIKLKPVCFLKRHLDATLPNWNSLLLYFLLFFGFFNLFNTNLSHGTIWISLLLYMPLPIYFIIIKPYLESKIYIIRITLDENKQEIIINYYEFNKKKQIKISLQKLKYNIIYSGKTSLSTRIIFYENVEKVLTQYSNSNWTVHKMNDVAQSLKRIGIKKPSGYNL